MHVQVKESPESVVDYLACKRGAENVRLLAGLIDSNLYRFLSQRHPSGQETVENLDSETQERFVWPLRATSGLIFICQPNLCGGQPRPWVHSKIIGLIKTTYEDSDKRDPREEGWLTWITSKPRGFIRPVIPSSTTQAHLNHESPDSYHKICL